MKMGECQAAMRGCEAHREFLRREAKKDFFNNMKKEDLATLQGYVELIQEEIALRSKLEQERQSYNI